MNRILLAAPKKNLFDDMIQAFETHKIAVDHIPSGEPALKEIESGAIQLIIGSENLPDMSGRELIEQAIMKNPMMNCVVASGQSAKQFHETYEGLGVLMQFPEKPGSEHVQALMEHLAKIHSLSNPSK